MKTLDNESNPLSLLTNSSKIKSDKSLQPRLRPIIIDGSNVSFAHGKQKEFSVQGIRLALDYFKKRGHKDIVIVVPRHYQGKGGRYFDELEHSGMLTYTPSRTLNQERQAVYDDRVILQLAADKNAVIISNDQYRDLMSENAKFRKLIETRLLPYVMSGNTFLLPEDPYGPKGPSLSECLTISNSTKD
ncbi:NEDD4 binding protein 1, variant 2 [Schistosoma haematobium]|uniref:NEDD4 binding protein 1, variant 2 n=1 Tax=Schistosoma haematobium TaxID=6185 RepID=A0A922S2I7_SCHHA|nr:NEDD4 binding protein 1, variant 2 [Schistosoma haematobium]KAH9590765.1 NEDD4 binding protein 1, variant 2 [Schistosoma haematobium]